MGGRLRGLLTASQSETHEGCVSGAVKGTATILPQKEGFQEEVTCELDLKDDELTIRNRRGRVSRKGVQEGGTACAKKSVEDS